MVREKKDSAFIIHFDFDARLERDFTTRIADLEETLAESTGWHLELMKAVARREVAKRFDLSCKITGGQRIDLLGVKKDDLPGVWRDLDMPSGHAYAKALRTVKTCVGSEWCRFGTQDSTGLGIKIEKFMWGSWTPAKVKLGVSGCPRNCAEATCKDVGVICVDSGFEIHFAGAAGLHIKGTEFLAKVATEEETLEVIAALTQLYREQGWYLERMYKWCDRVGLDPPVAERNLPNLVPLVLEQPPREVVRAVLALADHDVQGACIRAVPGSSIFLSTDRYFRCGMRLWKYQPGQRLGRIWAVERTPVPAEACPSRTVSRGGPRPRDCGPRARRLLHRAGAA